MATDTEPKAKFIRPKPKLNDKVVRYVPLATRRRNKAIELKNLRSRLNFKKEK